MERADPNTEAAPATDDAHLRERTVANEEMLRGRLLHAMRATVLLPDGGTATREYIVHPGAVMVVPLLDDGRLVMERQWRHPVDRVMIEFPAGKIDPGEDRLACAARELREETGYAAREWAYAGQLHPVVSYSTEFIDVWFARGLTLGERRLDDEEFLDVIAVRPEELLAWCRDGRVTDAKTLIGSFWLQNVLSGSWVLDWQPSDKGGS